MAGKISNPRDLLVLLMAELLHVERRLAGGVLRELASSVHDEELKHALLAHLEETKGHVDRLEIAFRRLEVAPSANYSLPFEGAVRQHDELVDSIVAPALADCFHAQSALHTEHFEIAAYTAILSLAEQSGHGEATGDLRASLNEEEQTRGLLESTLDRLGSTHAG